MTDIDHYFKNLKDLSEPELKAADITHKNYWKFILTMWNL